MCLPYVHTFPQAFCFCPLLETGARWTFGLAQCGCSSVLVLSYCERVGVLVVRLAFFSTSCRTNHAYHGAIAESDTKGSCWHSTLLCTQHAEQIGKKRLCIAQKQPGSSPRWLLCRYSRLLAAPASGRGRVAAAAFCVTERVLVWHPGFCIAGTAWRAPLGHSPHLCPTAAQQPLFFRFVRLFLFSEGMKVLAVLISVFTCISAAGDRRTFWASLLDVLAALLLPHCSGSAIPTPLSLQLSQWAVLTCLAYQGWHYLGGSPFSINTVALLKNKYLPRTWISWELHSPFFLFPFFFFFFPCLFIPMVRMAISFFHTVYIFPQYFIMYHIYQVGRGEESVGSKKGNLLLEWMRGGSDFQSNVYTHIQ